MTRFGRGLRGVLGQLSWPPFVPDLPLDALERRYRLPTSRWVDVDGLRVHVSIDDPPQTIVAERDQRERPTLVLVHGLVASLHTWDGWVAELVDSFRIVRLDLPGFGLTGPHPAGRYDADTLIEFFERFRQVMGIEKMHLAGNSLGGFVSWLYALRHPERVEKMILIDPVAYPQELLPFIKLLTLPGAARLALRINPTRSVAQGVREVFGDAAKISADAVRRYQDLALRPGNRAALVAYCREMLQMHANNPYEAQIRDLAVPTLLMWGTLDRWIPPRHVPLWQRDVKDLQVKLYEGVGHVPMEEAPEETARDARAFLQGAS